MAEVYQPKIGDKALVKVTSGLVPYPPDARPIRYLSKKAFTRVRIDAYLLDICRQGSLEVMPAPAAAAKKDESSASAATDSPKTASRRPAQKAEE
jgi:hypothetical protein